MWVDKIAQQVNSSRASQAWHLSSIPKTHGKVTGENKRHRVVLSLPHVSHGTYTCTRAHHMPYVEGTVSPACKFDYTSMAQTVTSLLHCPSDTGDMVRLTFMSLALFLFFFFCCECFLVKLCPSGCMLGGYQAGVTRMVVVAAWG